MMFKITKNVFKFAKKQVVDFSLAAIMTVGIPITFVISIVFFSVVGGFVSGVLTADDAKHFVNTHIDKVMNDKPKLTEKEQLEQLINTYEMNKKNGINPLKGHVDINGYKKYYELKYGNK
ncbi:hypothetical protein CDEF62S_02380 [Castellaniella defragrans]